MAGEKLRNGDFEHCFEGGNKLKISSRIYAPLQSMCTLQREGGGVENK